jgi:hypothetical protein
LTETELPLLPNMYSGRYMSSSKPSVLYSFALVSGMKGQIQFSVTPAGSASVALPPATAAAVEDGAVEADEEDVLLLDGLLLLLLHAAMPTASRAAAPATATRARRGRRLFRNINCAPWLCC